jgi:hypothetical protein
MYCAAMVILAGSRSEARRSNCRRISVVGAVIARHRDGGYLALRHSVHRPYSYQLSCSARCLCSCIC